MDNAPSDDTVDDVLRLMRNERYMNRGRWAAYVVRLGAANSKTRASEGFVDGQQDDFLL